MTVTVRVLPGKEIRLGDQIILQPAIVFRGASMLTVQSDVAGTGETVILFEPIGDGAIEIRFEGILYGLVRLLAVPLANAKLREVRVQVAEGREGTEMVNVTMLMEATGREGDARRLLVFQDVRRKRLVRDAFATRTIAEKTEQVFTYFTPTRRYTYRRVKTQPR